MTQAPTYDQCRNYRLKRNMPWFTKAWDLNFMIWRSNTTGLWDDWITVSCVDDKGMRHHLTAKCTADAWEGEWPNPTHPDGTGYVLDQHVPQGLVIGIHREGTPYARPALRQNRPFWIVRWPKGPKPTVAQLEARAAKHKFFAIRGMHVHSRVSANEPARPARDDSEGCTVPLVKANMNLIMEYMERQRARHGVDTVSPTYAQIKDVE